MRNEYFEKIGLSNFTYHLVEAAKGISVVHFDSQSQAPALYDPLKAYYSDKDKVEDLKKNYKSFVGKFIKPAGVGFNYVLEAIIKDKKASEKAKIKEISQKAKPKFSFFEMLGISKSKGEVA